MHLAHMDKKSIPGTSNQAQYLDRRREMMQSYKHCSAQASAGRLD